MFLGCESFFTVDALMLLEGIQLIQNVMLGN